MTSLPSRRRLLGQVVAAAGGTLLAGQAGRAFAASQPASFPPIGQTINLSLNAFGATLAVNLPPPLPTLNFIGSMRVKVLAGGADFVRLQTLHLTMAAHHPLFGTVTLRLPDLDVGPLSILKIGPGGITANWNQSMEATFERSGDTEGPFVYETLDPAKWVAHLTHYPPPPQQTNPNGSPTGGALFQLQAPIRLGTVSPTGKKTPYAQLQGMNVNQGQLPGTA
ncbi:hypothetical protein ACIA6C_15930 [Streptomyces sp. NPDC051578]|uniref:hypothetical protein n=1 Tax=Streptomyces sp. NPDC051578 TaxID=3365662 RepID=UPI00379915D9